MTKIISVVALMLTCIGAFAYNPSMTDFGVTQFNTNGNKLALRNGLLVTNPVAWSGVAKVATTNENSTNLVMQFGPMTTGNVAFNFGTPNSASSASWAQLLINATHGGSSGTPANTEVQWTSAGHFAFGPGFGVGGIGHIQIGIGIGPYWIYNQAGRVDMTVANSLGVGVPYMWRTDWNSNGVVRSAFPGFVSVAASTSGDYEFWLFHDSGSGGLDNWTTNTMKKSIVAYGSTSSRKRGNRIMGTVLQEKTNITVTSSPFAIDFAQAQCIDLTCATTNITFYVTNDSSGYWENHTVLIRGGAYSPALVFPATWNIEGVTVGGTAPTNVLGSQMVIARIGSTDIGAQYKTVQFSKTTDFSFQWDTNFLAFATLAGAGNLTLAQSNSLNQLVLNAKAHGWWTNCDAIYPFIGGTSNAHSINLKSPGTFSIAFTATGVGHDAMGATFDGATGYGDTGFTPSTAAGIFTQDSAHVLCYAVTNWNVASAVPIGTVSGQPRYALLRTTAANTVEAFGPNYIGSSVSTTSGSDYRGPMLATRTSSTLVSVRMRSGTYVNSGSIASTALPTTSIYVGAENNGGGNRFTPTTLAFATIGGGVSSALSDLMNTDIDEFQSQNNRKFP